MVGAAAAPAAAHQSTGNTRCAEPGGGSIGAEDGGADDEDHEDQDAGATAAVVFSPPTRREGAKRRRHIVTPSTEDSGMLKKPKPSLFQLPRSFFGQPGTITIQVSSFCLHKFLFIIIYFQLYTDPIYWLCRFFRSLYYHTRYRVRR